jgi:hypothetical protein
MRQFTKLGAALMFAVLVATGFAALSTSVSAQGAGRGNSQAALCRNLAAAEEAVNALEPSEFKDAALANINEQQAALGCDD